MDQLDADGLRTHRVKKYLSIDYTGHGPTVLRGRSVAKAFGRGRSK